MKDLFLLCLLSFTLMACSVSRPAPETEDASTVVGDEPYNQKAQGTNLEMEMAKLKTRLEALETKFDVLANTVERAQIKQSQPEISAETNAPQPGMAAPVLDNPVVTTSLATEGEAPRKATKAAVVPLVETEKKEANSAVEKEFHAAMAFFQSGRNLEAASQFSTLAKQYPDHLLASHALYWSGEASARGQQWSSAIASWEKLEKNYPFSPYLPEALAGLARAYDSQGNPVQAKHYRELLTQAFPTAPVTMNLIPRGSNKETAPSGNPPAEAVQE